MIDIIHIIHIDMKLCTFEVKNHQREIPRARKPTKLIHSQSGLPRDCNRVFTDGGHHGMYTMNIH